MLHRAVRVSFVARGDGSQLIGRAAAPRIRSYETPIVFTASHGANKDTAQGLSCFHLG